MNNERLTGATDAQIEAAILRYLESQRYPDWYIADALRGRPSGTVMTADRWAPFFVPPGQVITDAERVPTDDELAEWRRLVGGADEGYVDLPSLDVLRAYLERQR